MEAIFFKGLNLWAAVIFFLLSLLGAIVLFKFLKSSAIIKNAKYKAGGAIAGFVILFTSLTVFYDNKTNDELNKLRDDYNSLKEKIKLQKINGSLIPSDASGEYEENLVILAVQQTDPDINGRFSFSVKCIDPEEDDIKVYALASGTKGVKILEKEEMTEIKLPRKRKGGVR